MVEKNQAHLFGSALLFLVCYLGVITYSIFPYTLNLLIPMDISRSGWSTSIGDSGFTAAANNTIVQNTYTTMTTIDSSGSLFTIALLMIVVVAVFIMMRLTLFSIRCMN